MDPPVPDPPQTTEPPRRSRGVLPSLKSFSQTVRNSIITIADPLTPSHWGDHNQPNSSDSNPDLEKLPHCTTIVHHHHHHHQHTTSTSATDDSASIVSHLTSNTTATTPQQPRTLSTLPPELQIAVLRFLDFPDILNLRRTCKHWYHFATPRLLRSLHGAETFRTILLSHCSLCLAYCPSDTTRLATTPRDHGYPLSSHCVRCTVQRGGVCCIGQKTTLGNSLDYWTCRWCGWPVTADAATGHPQFHRLCYDSYAFVLLAFFLLGWFQFVIGVVAAALAWRYYRHNVLVLAPTVVGFVVMWVCIFVLMFRGNRVRTYHWALVFELTAVGLWVAPLYTIAKEFATNNLTADKVPAEFFLAFVALNMLFRILNVLGNIVLLTEYDRTRHYIPRISAWRRFMNPLLTTLIFWTYPQHTERKRGPDWA